MTLCGPVALSRRVSNASPGGSSSQPFGIGITVASQTQHMTRFLKRYHLLRLDHRVILDCLIGRTIQKRRRIPASTDRESSGVLNGSNSANASTCSAVSAL